MFPELRIFFMSLNLRVFDDSEGAMWKSSVKDIDGEILCVSQFTLFGSTLKAKPDFHSAMVSSAFVLCAHTFLKELTREQSLPR
jgi:D-aminoacyl-tRNA deacylase